MKIFRVQEIKYEPREGYALGILAEMTLAKEVSSIGFFRPRIPPKGKLRNHYHDNSTEFMVFSQNSQIKVGERLYTISPGDIVCLLPGEPHEIIAGDEGATPLVIKLPNNPKDTKFL